MAKSYRSVLRDQQFLLPVDMREWLPPGHLVWFVLSVLEEVDTSAFHGRNANAGAGRAAFDPDMLLALLVYGYCRGVRSSRQIERLCEVDVAFRVICAQDVPDHTTIARFRQAHDGAFASLFVQVLALAARAGLGRFGTIAIDGTKIAANASLDANRKEAWLREQVEAIVAEAERVDAAEDEAYGPDRGDELPDELVDPTTRVARIRAALDQVEADRAARAKLSAEQVAKAEQRMADIAAGAHPPGPDPRGVDPVAAARARLQVAHDEQQARIDAHAGAKAAAKAAGTPPPTGRPPAPVPTCKGVREADAALERELARAKDKSAGPPQRPGAERLANVTDPASRIMPTRRGWVQGYNVQVAVTGDQLIVATGVGQSPVDAPQLEPMISAAQTAADLFATTGDRPGLTIGTVLADAGYASNTNLASGEGPDRLIALGKGRAQHRDARQRPAHGPPPEGATPREAMDHRLRTTHGSTLYKRRGATVEPAIGNLKKLIDRFSRRGLHAATAEIDLAAAAFNLLKIHRAQLSTA